MSSATSSVDRHNSAHMKSIATRDTKGGIHPEIQQVVRLTLAHSGKIYCSGPLFKRLERNADGTIVRDAKWTEVWARLGGTTLSVWDMEAIKKAGEEGREEPPTYIINVTDSQVQVLGSIMTAATTSSPEHRRTHIVTMNTTGSNLILFECQSHQTILSWATALRLASWEKSRIEEIYTGHLLRLSMMGGNQFREPVSTLEKGKLEGWAKVRIGGGTKWQRLWVVISLDDVSGSRSIYTKLASSTIDPVKKNRLSTFLGGNKGTPSSSGDGSAWVVGPAVAMYPGNKARDKNQLLYSATSVTQAFAVYPERPEGINRSSLFKIEGTIKGKQLPLLGQLSGGVSKARDGYVLVMPEVESGKPGSGEMLKWLIAVAFRLYGRPEGYSWDPRNPLSLFFAYPYGPYRSHLFLDRELAEVVDVRIHETSQIRRALMNILIECMSAAPPSQRQPQMERRDGHDGRPQLPRLQFNSDHQEVVDLTGASALTTIREQSRDSQEATTQYDSSTVHHHGYLSDHAQTPLSPVDGSTIDSFADSPPVTEFVPLETSGTHDPLPSADVASPPSAGSGGSPILSNDVDLFNLRHLMDMNPPKDLTSQVRVPTRTQFVNGGLATVYLGWMGSQQVAVKVLRIPGTLDTAYDINWEERIERRSKRERDFWAAVRHANISEFLGYCTDLGGHPVCPAMISVWYKYGTSIDYLKREKPPVNERLRLTQDTLNGLHYLHRLNVVHGDLKPTNILVDDRRVARICDFGLVRLADNQGPTGMTTTARYSGTDRYKAPELFYSRFTNPDPKATFEGDIYALGCVMLELIERIRPFKEHPHEGIKDAVMAGETPAVRRQSMRALFGLTDDLWELLDGCWALAPGRPVIGEVVNSVSTIAQEFVIRGYSLLNEDTE